jgi:hypothetical protein
MVTASTLALWQVKFILAVHLVKDLEYKNALTLT